MKLALALYAEGDPDSRFLSLIIQRTSRKVLADQQFVDDLTATLRTLNLIK